MMTKWNLLVYLLFTFSIFVEPGLAGDDNGFDLKSKLKAAEKVVEAAQEVDQAKDAVLEAKDAVEIASGKKKPKAKDEPQKPETVGSVTSETDPPPEAVASDKTIIDLVKNRFGTIGLVLVGGCSLLANGFSADKAKGPLRYILKFINFIALNFSEKAGK